MTPFMKLLVSNYLVNFLTYLVNISTLLKHHSSQELQLWQPSTLSISLTFDSVVHITGPVMLDSSTILEGT